MASNSSTMSLKLLIDVKSDKVLFAEAGKDFVDFLFSLLSLSLGTVTKLLAEYGMAAGSVSQLYGSVENLSVTYMQLYVNKNILLKPNASVAGPNVLGLPESPARNRKKVYYMCSKNIRSDSYNGSHRYVTEDPSESCPSCNSTMSIQATYVGQPEVPHEATSGGVGAAGYVKSVVTYMIMDNLDVKPMSTISSITLLNSFNVKDLGNLQEKVVEFGMDEGVKLLKESLYSNSVLTNVFLLGKKSTV